MFFRKPVNYIDVQALNAINTTSFENARPFPHVVIDNFLSESFFSKLVSSIPEIPSNKGCPPTDKCFHEPGKQYNKLAYEPNNLTAMDAIIKKYVDHMTSPKVLRQFRRISGIPDLNFYKMDGAGVHRILRGGMLQVHADFNRKKNKFRRFNTFIYLNPDWREEYGGHLELWNREMTRCESSILPIANRFVMFKSTDYSYHGHPHELTCPQDRNRRSIALYLYSKSPPDKCSLPYCAAHSTLFKTPKRDAAMCMT